MIDLHAHVLPGVDDGPAALGPALEMCRMATADGCTQLVATPHQRRDPWPTDDPAQLAAVLTALSAATGGRPTLHLGGEVRVDSELLEELDAAGRAGIQTLAGSRYILLEFDPGGFGPEPVELIRDVRARDLVPVVAHPEITPFFWRADENPLPRMVEAGALLQITGASVAGDFGRAPRERAWELLEAGLVHFVASDAHRPDWRPPGLSRARRAIAAQLGEEVARLLTETNPLAVVENRAIESPVREEAI